MALPTPFDEPPRAPLADNGQVWANWSKWFWQLYKRILEGALGGDVVGPSSSTDNAVVRWDGVTGKLLQNSGVIIDDSNNVTIPTLTSGRVVFATTGGKLTTATTETANTLFAGPTTGAAAVPAFRALVAADLPAGTGTVTSVAQTVPSAEFAVSGSPITTSGTLAITKQVQNANKGWFGPTTGADAQPTFRALVTADLPSGTGTVTSVDVSGGTTGLTTSGGPITGSGTITIAGQVNLGALNPSALAFAASYG